MAGAGLRVVAVGVEVGVEEVVAGIVATEEEEVEVAEAVWILPRASAAATQLGLGARLYLEGCFDL